MGRGAVCLALLQALTWAQAPDGAIADSARWTGPHGPASNSRRSRAMAVARDVVEAWSLELPGESLAAPVHWDGKLYALCAAKKGTTLVAVDLRTGKLLGRRYLMKGRAEVLSVWGGAAIVLTDTNQLGAFKHAGRGFYQSWRCSLSGTPTEVRVLENEVYVAYVMGLERYELGRPKPTWVSILRPPIAVYGRFVFGLAPRKPESVARRSGDSLDLVAVHRNNGLNASEALVAYYDEKATRRTRPSITVTSESIIVGDEEALATTKGPASHAFVPVRFSGRSVAIGECEGLATFDVPPGVCKQGFITSENRSQWMWWRAKRGQILAKRKFTPDLFEHVVAPTVVGDVAYFGTWAADMVTGEVLWRLPLKQVRHGAVPADRLVVVVDERSVLRAYRERLR